MISFPVPNVSPEAQTAFQRNHAKIISQTVERLLSQPGQFGQLGDRAETILANGFEFTSSTLEACMLINDASLLIDQLRWTKDRLPHDGISMERMLESLRVYAEVITELLPASQSAEIVNIIQHMIRVQKAI